MTSKYEFITDVYSRVITDISKTPDNWTEFLSTASRNFKYRFDEQVLIYAQSPQATACAEIDFWNEKLKRWVNKNAKGIALLTEKNGTPSLRYVFDVADTHQYHNKEFKLWQVEEKYEDEIIEALEDRFGELEIKDTIANAIMSVANITVDDNIQDYLSDLLHFKDGSLLEELDELNIEISLRTILTNSVAYMIMQRCGIDANMYLEQYDFKEIRNFNTYDTITRMGTASSDIAETVLREIAITITNVQKLEKNQNRTFEQNNKINYPSSIRKESIGRSEDYDRLHETRRLSNTKLDSTREHTREDNRGIFNNEVESSKTKQEGGIYSTINEEQITRTLEGNSNSSNTENRTDSRGNGETGWNNRRIETKQPDEMGRTNEQLQDDSRGNDNAGTNIQLNLLPTVEEQINKIEEVENNIPAFSFSGEMIDKTLQQGSNFQEGKYRIYEQFQKSLSTKENIDFLKHEYGIGGGSSAFPNSNIGQMHDAKGIKLYEGYAENRPEMLIKWNQAEKRIKELIREDRYLNPKEKEYYPTWIEEKEQERQLNEARERLVNIEKTLPEYEYHIGDKVYIGADEYEIDRISVFDVSLYDPRYPLFGRTMNKDEFERKVQENPVNDHLKKENRKESIDEVSENKKHREIIEDIVQDLENPLPEKELEENIISINFQNKRKTKLQDYNLHPEIQEKDRNNFKITNDELGIGTPREKFRRNIEAIKVLKLCETEDRYATPKEQEILSEYIGWGGLPQAFDENNTSWTTEYLELKNLLNEDEYSEARESTLTAFYTPPVVIRAIYKALEDMGLKEGNILEPSCGTGNFLGMLPKNLQNCKMYGVELDTITGRIAQQLYQKSVVAVQGYEKVELPDNFFDIAIGNVPFGDFKVLDKRYDKNKFFIHDYFFAKTLDKVRPRWNSSIYHIKRYYG